MRSKTKIWSIGKLASNIKLRQKNKYDMNIAVTGNTGEGKSTFVGKLCYRIDGFDPWKHQVYNREDVISLITEQKFGICWDDEAINSSYKREYQNVGQQDLIKTVAMYRSNFNLYFAVLPNFYSLDKDLRDLYAIHIFIIRRGLAVMLRRDSGSIFASDKWYTKYNQKLEESWQKKKEKNSTFKIPYHKLKGFICYIKYNDLTPKQRELIDKVKETKRDDESKNKKEVKGKSFLEKIYDQLIAGKLTKDWLQQTCLVEDKKFSSITTSLNRMLKDNGETNTVKNYFDLAINEKEKEKVEDIISVVPTFD